MGRSGNFFAERGDQHGSRAGLEETRHVLDGQDVDAVLDKLLGEINVVIQRVLRLLGVRDVARVADGRLHDAVRLAHRIDAELEVIEVVERVEDAENVHASGAAFFTKAFTTLSA